MLIFFSADIFLASFKQGTRLLGYLRLKYRLRSFWRLLFDLPHCKRGKSNPQNAI